MMEIFRGRLCDAPRKWLRCGETVAVGWELAIWIGYCDSSSDWNAWSSRMEG